LEVSDQIIKVLDKIAEQFGMAIDWTKENIVPYIQDLVSRYAQMQVISNIVAGGAYLIIGTVSGFILVNIIRQWTKRNLDSVFIKSNSSRWDAIPDGLPNVLGIALLIASAIALLVAIIELPTCVNSIIRWLTVPEVQILADLKQMTK